MRLINLSAEPAGRLYGGLPSVTAGAAYACCEAASAPMTSMRRIGTESQTVFEETRAGSATSEGDE